MEVTEQPLWVRLDWYPDRETLWSMKKYIIEYSAILFGSRGWYVEIIGWLYTRMDRPWWKLHKCAKERVKLILFQPFLLLLTVGTFALQTITQKKRMSLKKLEESRFGGYDGDVHKLCTRNLPRRYRKIFCHNTLSISKTLGIMNIT